MALTLTTADLGQLESCLRILLSPLTYGRVGDWRTASRDALERLLGADSSAFILPLQGEPLIEAHPDNLPAQLAYEWYYHACDFVLTQRRRELGLEVYHRDDTLGFGFQIDSGQFPAGINFDHERDTAARFGERGVALLRLLLPAFKAGVVTCLRHAHYRIGLEGMLDGLGDALALLTREGRMLHANPAMRRSLAGDAERHRVDEELTRLARAVGELGRRRGNAGRLVLPVPVIRDVRTARCRYRLRASLIGGGPGDGETVLVSHGLTLREIQVARLLARSRAAVAARLQGLTEA